MLVFASAVAFVGTVALATNAVAYRDRAQALRSLRPCDRPDDLAWPYRTVAFLRECAAWTAVVALHPVGWMRREPVEPGSDAVIILIHDLGLNAGAFTLLRHRLRRSGWRTVVSMRHPASLADVEQIAARLHEVVEEVAAKGGHQIVLVGHGFGGLVARFYARHYQAPLVHRMLTLGTPHQGSVSPRSRNADMLRPDGPLLSELRVGDHVPQELDVIALHSTFDANVLPPTNAEYPRAFNIKLNDAGHNTLLFSRKVYELVEENLAAPLPHNDSSGEPAEL